MTANKPILIARSEGMRNILRTIDQIAPTNVTVLLQGESGTGKDMLARAIHERSLRKDKPLVAVNCAALPESILESELFGHEKGAFTDAKEQRKGRFELASGGTLFLDEIGEMNPSLQAKLLRVLEDSELMRVGGTKPVKIDTRIVTATNRNLEAAIARKEFRQDLYYRLKVISVDIPPLRERHDDIPALVDTFITEFCEQNNLSFPGLTPDAMDVLLGYGWPGNIRELQNLIKNLIILSPNKKVGAADLPHYLTDAKSAEPERHLPIPTAKTTEQVERELIYRAVLELKNDIDEVKLMLRGQTDAPLPGAGPAVPVNEERTMEDIEKETIHQALEELHYNKKAVARKLGIGLRTIYRKIEKYGLD